MPIQYLKRQVMLKMKRFTAQKKSTLRRIALVALMAMLLLCVSGCTDNLKGMELIAEGVSAAGIDLGGMTKKEAMAALESGISDMKEVVLDFVCEGKSFSVSSGELKLKADAEKTADKAYSVGRTKDEKQNKEDIRIAKKDGITISPVYTFDEDKLSLIVSEQCADKVSDPAPMTVETGEDCLIVTNAVEGMIVNMDKAKAAIEKELADFKADAAVELFIEEYKPENLTFEEFKKEYLREAKDAVYTKEGDKHNIEPEVVGIDFDVDEAKKIFEENKNSKESYKIPAVITHPEVTAKFLEDKYVNNIIATYTTSFAGSSAGRITNIQLAASKIDGYVLNPGERFSYNGVVGPRTSAAGFKMAHVYVGNQVVDGIGGGICQVSSTLYNAVVLADLKTVSRTNHSMPVSYVPMGRDATVSYGTIDYVFENNKSYPISIKSTVSGTNLTIAIVGASQMDYTVEFISSYNSTIPFGTVTTEDASLPSGEQKVLSNGSNGSVYNSYRVYKKDGVEYDRKYESKSRYQPTAQRIAVGTGTAVVPGTETVPGGDEPSVWEPPVPPVGGENAVAPSTGEAPVQEPTESTVESTQQPEASQNESQPVQQEQTEPVQEAATQQEQPQQPQQESQPAETEAAPVSQENPAL